MGTKDWQTGKLRFGILDTSSSDIPSWPSKAQKGMKADTGEPGFKCTGWETNSGTTPEKVKQTQAIELK